MARASSPTRITEAQRDGAIDTRQNRRRWPAPLLSFMRGQEALHEGGVKPAQLKAAAEAMIVTDSHRLTGAGIDPAAARVRVIDRMVQN